MNSFKRVNRQTGFLVTVGALLLAFVAPGLVPAFASADQVSARSIELSTSSSDASGVHYTINFTPVKNAGAFVVEFCTITPVIGEACTAPGGFKINNATATDTANNTVNALTTDENNAVEVTTAMTATTPVSVELNGVHNPTASGTIYARIVTYAAESDALAYTSTNIGSNTKDQGSVALEITDTIGVQGAVLESLSFCASSKTISDGCGLQSNSLPNLTLGKTTGSVVALDPSEVSTGDIYTQISTNAASGAIVSLKSSATSCGGLINSSKPSGCFIGPAQQGGISAGNALFGVKTSTATGGSGTYQPKPLSGYNNTTYALNYDASNNNASGVTSPYGDPFLDTGDGVVSNKNMTITFGASVAPNTPAGNYGASISLIATGKF